MSTIAATKMEEVRSRSGGRGTASSEEAYGQRPAKILQPITLKSASKSSGSDEILDLICVGFGPASLAIAIALEERTSSRPNFKPKVAFLERQPKFAWHAGMQLPGAKMQISFLKDLATPHNPRSHFTFINYLFEKRRLNNFINLGTFLPTRFEYEDYLRWCASHFEQSGVVSYGQSVVEVVPDAVDARGQVTSFTVVSEDHRTKSRTTRRARRVVISVGGEPVVPKELPAGHPQLVHSSQYSNRIDAVLPDANKPYNIAVVGNGQSAAEIYNDLPNRYPNAKVTLLIKGSALRPSDDSPFVNEIFDPDRVDGLYRTEPTARACALAADRATNYGVVRLELLEHLYEQLYIQKLKFPNQQDWKRAIVPNRQVVATRPAEAGNDEKLVLRLQKLRDDGSDAAGSQEEMVVDAVFFATGYVRNAHERMLAGTRDLLRAGDARGGATAAFPVRRDYGVDFDEAKVARGAGVWLQGCNEKTHGLSDTLLSILAVRGDELVGSMFDAGIDVQDAAAGSIRAKL